MLGWTMLNELRSRPGWDQLATRPLSPPPLTRKSLNESADRWRLQNSPTISVHASIRPEDEERERHDKLTYLWLSATRATWMTTSFSMGPCRKQAKKTLEKIGSQRRRLKGKGTECKIHRLWVQEWVSSLKMKKRERDLKSERKVRAVRV